MPTTLDTVTRRKSGRKPPAVVAKMLARLFPQVHLLWATDVSRWCLVHVRAGEKPHLVRILRERDGGYQLPTVGNTINWLRQHHWSNFTGWAGKRFLERMDREFEQLGEGVERNQEGMRREMADIAYNMRSGRVLIPKPR